MAITCYVGVQGSGKTYEVVSSVIVEALRTGRRVVANIRGLHFEEMRAYLLDDCKMPEASIGSLVLVDMKVPLENEHFFYLPNDPESITQPGDLVCVDECWQNLGVDSKITPRVMDFMRMHRQHVNAAGVSCDIVLISQSMNDINRKVKVVIEKHFKMEKLKRVGMPNRYTVDVFNGYRISENAAISRLVRKYDKRFFPFYSSYAGKGGDEREVDKRISIFASPFFKYVLPVSIVLGIGGGWFAYHGMFGRYTSGDKKVVVPAGAVVGPVVPSAPGPTFSGVQAGGVMRPAAADLVAPAHVAPVLSEWRAVGFVEGPGGMVAVVERAGVVRYVRASNYRLSELEYAVEVDGLPAMRYGGGAVGGAGLGK